MQFRSVALSVLAIAFAFPALGRQLPEATVLQEAQKLASCIKALDTECVIAMSNVAGYQRISSPGFSFKRAQAQSFEAFKRVGWRYTSLTIDGTSEIFRKGQTLYAFVPFREELLTTKRSKVSAYFVAQSDDGGASWKFVDGTGLSIAAIQVLIPGYSGIPMPPKVLRN